MNSNWPRKVQMNLDVQVNTDYIKIKELRDNFLYVCGGWIIREEGRIKDIKEHNYFFLP